MAYTFLACFPNWPGRGWAASSLASSPSRSSHPSTTTTASSLKLSTTPLAALFFLVLLSSSLLVLLLWDAHAARQGTSGELRELSRDAILLRAMLSELQQGPHGQQGTSSRIARTRRRREGAAPGGPGGGVTWSEERDVDARAASAAASGIDDEGWTRANAAADPCVTSSAMKDLKVQRWTDRLEGRRPSSFIGVRTVLDAHIVQRQRLKGAAVLHGRCANASELFTGQAAAAAAAAAVAKTRGQKRGQRGGSWTDGGDWADEDEDEEEERRRIFKAVQRTREAQQHDRIFSAVLAVVARVMATVDVPFFIADGTLLGWARQCAVLPGDHDVVSLPRSTRVLVLVLVLVLGHHLNRITLPTLPTLPTHLHPFVSTPLHLPSLYIPRARGRTSGWR